jgi:hypothetical protein
MTFVLLGLSEAYWLAYPLFVLNVSGAVLNMGVVLALSAIMISAVTYLVNYFSDVKRTRVNFAMIGAALLATWFVALSFVTSTYQIVALSLLDGVAAAFNMSWFAHYGDSFSKEQYASILVLMETGLMVGRIANLAPTLAFIPSSDFASYFRFSAVVLVLLIPLYLISKKKRDAVNRKALSSS